MQSPPPSPSPEETPLSPSYPQVRFRWSGGKPNPVSKLHHNEDESKEEPTCQGARVRRGSVSGESGEQAKKMKGKGRWGIPRLIQKDPGGEKRKKYQKAHHQRHNSVDSFHGLDNLERLVDGALPKREESQPIIRRKKPEERKKKRKNLQRVLEGHQMILLTDVTPRAVCSICKKRAITGGGLSSPEESSSSSNTPGFIPNSSGVNNQHSTSFPNLLASPQFSLTPAPPPTSSPVAFKSTSPHLYHLSTPNVIAPYLSPGPSTSTTVPASSNPPSITSCPSNSFSSSFTATSAPSSPTSPTRKSGHITPMSTPERASSLSPSLPPLHSPDGHKMLRCVGCKTIVHYSCSVFLPERCAKTRIQQDSDPKHFSKYFKEPDNPSSSQQGGKSSLTSSNSAQHLCKVQQANDSNRRSSGLYPTKQISLKQKVKVIQDEGTYIAFINSRSGENQGISVMKKLQRLLSSPQVFDLCEGGPKPGLLRYYHQPNLRLIVCGGDGSVCWVHSILDLIALSSFPPVAVLPLGTGNDLARVLGWGGGYQGESLSRILGEIKAAKIVQMDRWMVHCVPLHDPEGWTVTMSQAGAAEGREFEKDDGVGLGLLDRMPEDQAGSFGEEMAQGPPLGEGDEQRESAGKDLFEGLEDVPPNIPPPSPSFSPSASQLPVHSPATLQLPTPKRRLSPFPESPFSLGIESGTEGESISNSPLLSSPEMEVPHVLPPPPEPGQDAQIKSLVMNNYFSIGVDAEVALKFHRLREEKPKLFKSRFINKGWYGLYGMEGMIRNCGLLHKDVHLFLDEVMVPFDKDIAGIMFLNIASYAGGTDPWGTPSARSKWGPASMCDGRVEVVGVTGTFHLGRIQAKLARGIRIGQASSVRIVTLREVPAQIDGEPWKMPPSDVSISFKNRVPMLRRWKGSGSHQNPRAPSAPFPNSPPLSSPSLSSPSSPQESGEPSPCLLSHPVSPRPLSPHPSPLYPSPYPSPRASSPSYPSPRPTGQISPRFPRHVTDSPPRGSYYPPSPAIPSSSTSPTRSVSPGETSNTPTIVKLSRSSGQEKQKISRDPPSLTDLKRISNSTDGTCRIKLASGKKSGEQGCVPRTSPRYRDVTRKRASTEVEREIAITPRKKGEREEGERKVKKERKDSARDRRREEKEREEEKKEEEEEKASEKKEEGGKTKGKGSEKTLLPRNKANIGELYKQKL